MALVHTMASTKKDAQSDEEDIQKKKRILILTTHYLNKNIRFSQYRDDSCSNNEGSVL
jgi:hypothetical protein